MNLLLAGIIISLALSAYFSACETAFLSFHKTRLQAWLLQKRRGANTLNSLSLSPERFLTTVLIGNNLANVLYSSLLALYLAEFGFSTDLIFIISPLILLVIAETFPKSIARQIADQIIIPMAVVLFGARTLLFPFVKIVEVISSAQFSKRSLSSNQRERLLSHAEISQLFKSAEIEGIDAQHGHLLRQTLKLGLLKVKDIMTPRTSVAALRVNTPLSEARKLFQSSGYTRIPCYDNSIDDVIGILSAKDLLIDQSDLRSILRKLPMVPASLPAIRLPQWFHERKVSLAGVIDEYGGFAGVVSVEDLVEEVVGPILDEHDRNPTGCVEVAPGVWLIDGATRLSHVIHTVGIELHRGNASSIGGYIIELAGRIPSVGAMYYTDNSKIEVIKTDNRSIKQVRITMTNRELP